MAPQLGQRFPFSCSDSPVSTFLQRRLDWAPGKARKVAKFFPKDRETLCEKTFYRIVYLNLRYSIPTSLLINMN